eukprot:CAMPEP_0115842468 /NCGR_PEP_ID=MMETSP0287-20121206/7816_1 /TAXON_ID=412157 /ORGANISM="Chrysochromulina rotalis, Strain UIO044" /LENGTH=36 /DNA_ID= /DNA_START= /DNA_END= /DNA_ORIENTATION=
MYAHSDRYDSGSADLAGTNATISEFRLAILRVEDHA